MISALPSYCMQTMLLPKGVCDKLDKVQRDFVWGAESGSKKIHQVKWETICNSKAQGGLGFSLTSDFNRALIMKLGRGLIHQPSSLWVQVLRGKYGCGTSTILVVKRRNRESLAWRGIRTTWDTLLKGCRWKVGAGSSVGFWTDSWLASGHKLQDVALYPIPQDTLHLLESFLIF